MDKNEQATEAVEESVNRSGDLGVLVAEAILLAEAGKPYAHKLVELAKVIKEVYPEFSELTFGLAGYVTAATSDVAK